VLSDVTWFEKLRVKRVEGHITDIVAKQKPESCSNEEGIRQLQMKCSVGLENAIAFRKKLKCVYGKMFQNLGTVNLIYRTIVKWIWQLIQIINMLFNIRGQLIDYRIQVYHNIGPFVWIHTTTKVHNPDKRLRLTRGSLFLIHFSHHPQTI